MARKDKNESKHDVFVRCISDRLRKLNVCDSHDEYVCISESISSSVSPDETPTEDSVDEIFLAIIPLFPIPAVIIFPLHDDMASTAATNDLLKILFIFFNSFI